MKHHLYEIALESNQMWIKLQASGWSLEQAKTFFQSRLGGENPDSPVPIRPRLFSFEISTKLSERVHNIENWESIQDSFPKGWDDHEFRLAQGPYPWCETLSDDCDCRGSKGQDYAVFCSDFGLQGETASRASKSPNVRHQDYVQRLRQRLANSQNAPRANGDAGVEALIEPSEQEGFYCQVDGRYHAFSERQVESGG